MSERPSRGYQEFEYIYDMLEKISDKEDKILKSLVNLKRDKGLEARINTAIELDKSYDYTNRTKGELVSHITEMVNALRTPEFVSIITRRNKRDKKA